MMPLDPFGFVLDLETTGLDPEFDVILEVGAILVDSELTELAWFNHVINWPEILYDQTTGEYTPPFGVHEKVVEMHTKNGLWKESYRTTNTVADSMTSLIVWANSLVSEKLPLIGNTIGFDKSFLSKQFNMDEVFHYRSVDISSVKILNNAWGDQGTNPSGNQLHRSIPDCIDSINQLKFYKKKLFPPNHYRQRIIDDVPTSY